MATAILAVLLLITMLRVSNINVPFVGIQRCGSLKYGVGAFTPANGNWQLGLLTGTTASTTNQGLTLTTLLTDNPEISYTGYARQTLTGVATTGTPDISNYIPFTFTALNYQPTGSSGLPVTATGWFIVDPTDGTLIMWQYFASAFTFSTTSSVCTLDPSLEDGQLA